MNEKEIATLVFEEINEKIHLYYHGSDDYSYYAENGDCSVRGTMEEIMIDLGQNIRYLVEKAQ